MGGDFDPRIPLDTLLRARHAIPSSTQTALDGQGSLGSLRPTPSARIDPGLGLSKPDASGFHFFSKNLQGRDASGASQHRIDP